MSNYSRADLISFITKRTFTTGILIMGEDTYSFSLSLNKEAIEIFLHSLDTQVRKNLHGQLKLDGNFSTLFCKTSKCLSGWLLSLN
jgi:hypothetical protein